MTIEKTFPFESCESCCECILDVNEQNLFSYEGKCQKIIEVGCKNSMICKRLKKQLEEEHEQST